MSVTGVFTKGRGIGHDAATSILRYIPRARVPWQPSRFGRENLTANDLARLWSRGRYRDGPGNYNSGYHTEKTHVLEDNTVTMIPKHELEKYMPDITIGPKALVTPVSLMSARNGHRVTHDMLHSYDAHIGRLDKPAVVDHDNITVEDPNRVGLNAATLDCRGRIYRWLRRGPFFQEDHYFRRSLKLNRDGTVPAAAHEAPLMRKIIRLAHRGHLKAACEEYRRITTIPPVEVYRALTACCIPAGLIADAVAIFEDGNAKLFYVSRDGEVLYNLMRCAIQAKHRVRVMWVYNVMRGRYYENVVVRAEIDLMWRYRIALLALEYLLDNNCAEEAATVYSYLVEENLLKYDVHVRVGLHMREALASGKTVGLSEDVMNAVTIMKDVLAVAPEVARALHQSHMDAFCSEENNNAGKRSLWSRHVPLPPVDDSTEKNALMWMQQNFGDVDIATVLRWARFSHSKDLMAKNRQKYLSRAVAWIELLSKRSHMMEEAPLTYMRKSKPLSLNTNTNVRVAWQTSLTRPDAPPRLLAREEGYVFHHTEHSRFVTETYRHPGETLQSRFLALQPIHTEVSAKEDFQEIYSQQQREREEESNNNNKRLEGLAGLHRSSGVDAPPVRILHHSVTSELHGGSSGKYDRGTLSTEMRGERSTRSTNVASMKPQATIKNKKKGDDGTRRNGDDVTPEF